MAVKAPISSLSERGVWFNYSSVSETPVNQVSEDEAIVAVTATKILRSKILDTIAQAKHRATEDGLPGSVPNVAFAKRSSDLVSLYGSLSDGCVFCIWILLTMIS
jgi:hypothetical protein